jgi:hypothetical protein
VIAGDDLVVCAIDPDAERSHQHLTRFRFRPWNVQ